MEGDLQQLMDRIKNDAVEAGRQEAEALLAQARNQAALLVRQAEEQARVRLEKAEQEAVRYTERSRQTLTQAARDVLITVGRGVEDVLSDLAADAAAQSLNPETLSAMLVKLAEAYAAQGGRETKLEVLLSEADAAQVVQIFKQKYQATLTQGLTLRAGGGIIKGFQVRVAGEQVYHDFTQEAVAEALTHFLRPHLAEIVTRAAKVASGGTEAKL
jgi:V/A-type H+-transporting ATPase subunit E